MGKLADAIIGVSSALISYRFLKAAFSKTEDSITALERRNGVPCPGSSKGRPCTYVADAGSIERRAAMIGKMIWTSSLDGRIRKLATQAISQRCDGQWCDPPRDRKREVARMVTEVRNPNSATRKAWDKIEGAFAYTKKNLKYCSDPAYVDAFASAKRSLEYGCGDCDDHTILLGSLLMAIGFPVGMRIYTTRSSPNGEPNHIAALVQVPPHTGKFIALDASVDKVREGGRTRKVYPGWEAPSSMISSYMDFVVQPGGSIKRTR